MGNKALVVGIDAYPRAPLHGCCNDANCVAQLLERNEDDSPNFSVRKVLNVSTLKDLRNLLRELFLFLVIFYKIIILTEFLEIV